MAVAREKGDQAKEQGGEDCDPALPVETALPVKNIHRSQPKTRFQDSTSKLAWHPLNHGSTPLSLPNNHRRIAAHDRARGHDATHHSTKGYYSAGADVGAGGEYGAGGDPGIRSDGDRA